MIPVKLPKEVLDLFPMWEYRCRNCGTIYGEPKQVCIKCGTAIDLIRDRIPPRFMKNHKAMSNYAHKILAPKLSPEQRNLLFKYFTELFSDGFESGIFVPPWTGTATSGVTVTVESASPPGAHHGTYYCKTTDIDTNGNWGGPDKHLASAVTDIYMRVYARMEDLFTENGRYAFGPYFFGVSPTYSAIGYALIFKDATGYRWGIRSCLGGSWVSYPAAGYETIYADQWYCVELRHNTDGVMQLWVDGTLKVDQSVSTSIGGFQNIRVESAKYDSSEPTARTNYFDCVVVADTYIGPEEEVTTYTKTWTTDALFKKLGIPKTLSVDAAFQKQDIPKTFGLDATFQKSFIIQKQIDALFKRFDILKSFAVDARFGALMTQTISRQIDVLLKKVDLTKNFGLDAYFGPFEAETYAKTFALDAIFAYKVRLPELWLDENGKIVLNISKPYTWVGS